jgi:hypothetical protein
VFGRADLGNDGSHTAAQNQLDKTPTAGFKCDGPAIEFARCFLRLANLPNFALDRLSRYEATLWRQAGQILYALEILDRRKPQERRAVFGGLRRIEVAKLRAVSNSQGVWPRL